MLDGMAETATDAFKPQADERRGILQCTVVILRSDRDRNKDRVAVQTLLILGFTLQANIPVIALLPETLLAATAGNHNALGKIIPRTVHQQNLPIRQADSPGAIRPIPYPNRGETHPLYQNKHQDTIQS